MKFQDKTIDYGQRYQEAVLGMVRGILEQVLVEGLPGAHHFFITFDTRVDGVSLSPSLQGHYPELMTIVLQNQFWGLDVDDDGFSVTLRFGGVQEPLVVPWQSLVAFADPSVEFGLELRSTSDDEPSQEAGASFAGAAESAPAGNQADSATASTEASEAPESEVADKPAEAEVLSFEQFKKRT